MAERIQIGYARLFELRVLHHYHLDLVRQGSAFVPFATLTIAEQEARLMDSGYDVQEFLEIQPTAGTNILLKNLGLIFKKTALGAVVVAPKQIELPTTAVFEFAVSARDSHFFSYTSGTWRQQKIHEFQHPSAPKFFRFKEGALLFANASGCTRTKNGDTLLMLSAEISVGDPLRKYPVEHFVNSNGQLWQAKKDDAQTSNAADWLDLLPNLDAHPAYAHQDDSPPATLAQPPAWVEIDPDLQGIELGAGFPDDIFALVRIEPLAAGASFGLLKNDQSLAKPVFQIHFKHRSTRRRYITPTGTTTETVPLPLTRFGNAGVGRKPPPDHVSADKDNGGKITALVSEIF